MNRKFHFFASVNFLTHSNPVLRVWRLIERELRTFLILDFHGWRFGFGTSCWGGLWDDYGGEQMSMKTFVATWTQCHNFEMTPMCTTTRIIFEKTRQITRQFHYIESYLFYFLAKQNSPKSHSNAKRFHKMPFCVRHWSAEAKKCDGRNLLRRKFRIFSTLSLPSAISPTFHPLSLEIMYSILCGLVAVFLCLALSPIYVAHTICHWFSLALRKSTR